MMNDYLRLTRNPNLKVGKLKDVDNAFEAELLTKGNSVIDKIHIDKNIGRVRSASRYLSLLGTWPLLFKEGKLDIIR